MPIGYPIYVDEKYPDIAKQFVNPKEVHVGLQSEKETQFICKYCQKIFVDKVRNVTKRGTVTCISCREHGISYPEKFMCSLLDQLNIEFNLHYYSDWTNGYYYDFEFVYNNEKYIIETDGGLGHGHNGFKNTDIQKTILVDKEKDALAIANGYKIIRIDCYYPRIDCRFEYIKENAIKELSCLFNLENIDFDECNEYALGVLFYKIVDFYKNQSIYIDDICKEFHVGGSCVKNNLRNAMSMGILPHGYLHEHNIFKDIPVPVIKAFEDDSQRKQGRIMYCYDDAIAFDTIIALANHINVNPGTVSILLRDCDGRILGKHYCYYDDLPKDFDFKPINKPTVRNKPIYQYSKDKTKLIARYDNKSYLPPEFDYAHINKVCNNQRKSHKGFWWSYINIFETDVAQ